ncbi:MAG TPA: hypothetical protein VNI79_04890 [Sphingomicrobium sp.]|nr:hypothetical protein [Sphingomicrobium sp.]
MIRFLFLLLLVGVPASAQVARQTEADGYTRYELLAPGSSKFRILYDISATTPGATAYFNPIRSGSVATDESVIDRATGKRLAWSIVSGTVAAAGGVVEAKAEEQFIRVTLARPVPANGGEARLLIDKTYADPLSYFREGETIVFDRSLGVKRNAIVLPAGYELVTSNYPAQVLQEADGRIAVSFWNATPAPAPLRITARLARGVRVAASPAEERARQSREIVYELRAPETNSFTIAHDYTENRPGTANYVNVVRAGSTVSNPSARNLDTGEALRSEIVKGVDVLRAAPDTKDVGPTTQAVIFRFPPVKAGRSMRLRIAETYTDPASYKLQPDGKLVWERTLGRPANAVILPPGWMLEECTVPATITETPDRRVRLDFVNPRPDELAVRIVAQPRR